MVREPHWWLCEWDVNAIMLFMHGVVGATTTILCCCLGESVGLESSSFGYLQASVDCHGVGLHFRIQASPMEYTGWEVCVTLDQIMLRP